MINLQCGAGCNHCPFPLNQEKSLISVEDIRKKISKSGSKIILISGGEPFESLLIEEVIDLLPDFSHKLFRFATGGHIKLGRYLAKLVEMKNFQGISLSTDVFLNQRNLNEEMKKNWHLNLKLIQNLGIPYNITMTLDNENIDELKKISNFIEVGPDYILLSEEYRSHISAEKKMSFVEWLKENMKTDIVQIGLTAKTEKTRGELLEEFKRNFI